MSATVVSWSTALTCNGLFMDDRQPLRNIAGGSAFTMFLFYVISQIFYGVKYMEKEQPPGEPAPDQPETRPVGWNNKKWREWFMLLFAMHMCSLGFSVAFHPLAAAVIGWLHFFAYLVFMVINFVKRDDQTNSALRILNVITNGLMGVMNIALLIAGAAGLVVYNCI